MPFSGSNRTRRQNGAFQLPPDTVLGWRARGSGKQLVVRRGNSLLIEPAAGAQVIGKYSWCGVPGSG